MTDLSPTPQQHEAIEKIYDWYQGDEQIFRLFGFAGSGKTFLIKHIVNQLDIGHVMFGAFTGKAAHVMRLKGCDNASTLHRMIYIPLEKIRARLRELEAQLAEETDPAKRLSLERDIRVEQRRLDSPDWILRAPDDCVLPGADLLVIDEVSMVNEKMARDILSFGVKVVVLGDPAQLPPIEDGGYFTATEPDHLLTEIHRNEKDSPITRLATAIRNAPVSDSRYGVYGTDGDSGRRRVSDNELLDFDQVIVGKNDTRWWWIDKLRKKQGLTDPMPVSGDRIMALANSSETGIFNGQQFKVIYSEPHDKRDDQLRLIVSDDDGFIRKLRVWTHGFIDHPGELKAKRVGRGSVVAATFAQAITCHKAQGSEWDNVLIFDEASVFNRGARRDGQAWLYTAVTRASKRAVIF